MHTVVKIINQILSIRLMRENAKPSYPHSVQVAGYIEIRHMMTYRASHIILDYLQALTPKYAHNTRKKYTI